MVTENPGTDLPTNGPPFWTPVYLVETEDDPDDTLLVVKDTATAYITRITTVAIKPKYMTLRGFGLCPVDWSLVVSDKNIYPHSQK